MSKEKEIKEMINDIDINCNNIADKDCAKGKCALCISEHLVSVGYRKADEVRKETAKEIYERVDKWLDEIVPHTSKETILICLLGWIKAKYGVEVDE